MTTKTPNPSRNVHLVVLLVSDHLVLQVRELHYGVIYVSDTKFLKRSIEENRKKVDLYEI